jgi:hypothetical protein
MAGGRGGARVPRRAGARGGAALNLRRIEVIFQKFPGAVAAAAVSGLAWELRVGRTETSGTTGADGKVTIRMPVGGTAHLTVMGTEYRIEVRDSLPAVDTLVGLQRRLQMLGYFYQRPDGHLRESTEYAILNFQADNAPLAIDAIPNNATRQKLVQKVGE